MQTPEKQAVIDAINALGRRVTAADVAAKTGLPLFRATAELNKVAAECNGHLEVSTAGDVVYKFDPQFESAYIATGITRALEKAWQTVFNAGYFLLRISFGIMLILSFLIVIVLIVAVILAQLFANRDGSGDGGGGGGDGGFSLDFFDWMILRDLLFWGAWSSRDPYYGYGYGSSYGNQSRADQWSASTRRPQQKSNFLYNCFSFLFGDGNPNKNVEERKWQHIAQAIKNNHGVMTAEQLAPYTGADPKNEDGVLPVLVRFEGKPEVSETGNIIYTFPNMQVHASSQMERESVPVCLTEFPWPFSTVPTESMIPVYVLAGLNFFGSWWLMGQASHMPLLAPFAILISALTVYGTMFLALPLVRYLTLQVINTAIEQRNEKRQEYAAIVQNKPRELAAKLAEAAHFRIGERKVSADNIIYTTEKDALEQQFDHELGSPHPYIKDAHPANPKQSHAPQPSHDPRHKSPEHGSAERLEQEHGDDSEALGNKIYLSEKEKQERE